MLKAVIPWLLMMAVQAPAQYDDEGSGLLQDEFRRMLTAFLNGEKAYLDTASFQRMLEQRYSEAPDRTDLAQARGMLFYYQENYAKALEFLSELSWVNNHTRRMLAYSSYHEAKERDDGDLYAKAAEAYRRLPRDGLSREDCFKLCDALVKSGQRETAAREYEYLWREHPGAEEALLFLIDYYRETQDRSRLILKLEEFKQIHSEELGTYLELADLYGDENSKAVEILEEYLRMEPEDKKVQLKLAKLYEARGRKDAALDLYQKNAEQFSHDYSFNLNLADKLARSGKNEEAADYYRKAVKIRPSEMGSLLKLAKVYEKLGRSQMAMIWYANALDLEPQNRELRMKFLSLAGKLKDSGERVGAYERITSLDPKAHQAYFQLARAYKQQNDRKNAYESLDKALDIMPDNPEYLELLPEVIESDKEILIHFPQLKKLVRVSGKNLRAKVLLARGYALKKQPEQAAAHYEQVFLKDRSYLKGGKEPIQVFFLGKKYAAAGKLADEYLAAVDPKDKEVREIQVQSYQKSGAGKEKLRRAMRELLQQYPDTKGWWLELATLDLEQGDSLSAIKYTRNWTERHPKSVKGFRLLESLLKGRSTEQREYELVLEKLIKLEPGKAASRSLSLGMLKYDEGDYSAAEKLLAQSAKTHPANAKLQFCLGTIYSKPEFEGTGKAQFKKAHSLSPKNLKYAQAYAATLKSDPDIKANLKLFKFLVKRSPTVMDRVNLAKALHLNREYKTAAREWELLLTMDSVMVYDEPMALQSFIKAGKTGRVTSAYEIKLAAEPGNLGLLDTLCGIYKKTGPRKKYFTMLERIMDINMDLKDYQLWYARELADRGKTKKAMAHHSAWLDRHPGDKRELEKLFSMAKTAKDTAIMLGCLEKLIKIKSADKKYTLISAELKFLANGDAGPLETLVKNDQSYKKGRKLLVEHYFSQNEIQRLYPFEKYLKSESSRDKSLLLPLAEVQVSRKNYRDARETYYRVLKLGKHDKKYFDKVLEFSTKHQSPHLRKILELGYKSYPDDLTIKHRYAKSLGKSSKAMGVYSELIKNDRDNITYIKDGVAVALALRRHKAAVGWLERWGKEKPQEPEPWRQLAKIHKARGDSGNMAEALENLAEATPKDHGLAYRLGSLFANSNKHGRAADYFAKAADLQPSNKKYQRALGLSLSADGKLKKSKKPLEKVYSSKKFDEEVLYGLYRVYKKEKNLKLCRTMLRKLVDRKPANKTYAFPLAQLEVQLKKPLRAIRVLEHSRLKPVLTEEMAGLLLRQYVATRQVSKASDYGWQVSRKYPEETPPELGVLLYRNKRTSDARRMLDVALKHNPSEEAYYTRARIAYNDRVWKTAIKYFRKARKFNVESLRYLGMAYEHSRDYQKAIGAYEDYYDEVKKKEQLRKLYDLYKRVKDKDGICDVLKRMVKAYPKNFEYQKALADAYLANRQRRKAENQFRAVLKRSPRNAKANLYVGMADAKSRKCKQAVARIKTGLNTHYRNVEAWERLGDCYTALNKPNSAKRAYAKAKRYKAME